MKDFKSTTKKLKCLEDKLGNRDVEFLIRQRLRAQRETELSAHLEMVVKHNRTLKAKQEERTSVAEDLAYCEPIQDKIKALKDAFKLLPDPESEPKSTEGKVSTDGKNSKSTPGGPEPPKARAAITKRATNPNSKAKSGSKIVNSKPNPEQQPRTSQ